MQTLLLLGLAALSISMANEDSWNESRDMIELTAPKLIELKIPHTSSPLFIQAAASNGVTKLGFDKTKFIELQNKAYAAEGQEFTIDNFLGIDGAASKPLSLKAFEVFAEDAKLIMANEDGTDTELEKPNMLHLRGSISGDPSSLILLHMSPEASFGLVQSDKHHLSIEADPASDGHSLLIEASSFETDERQKEEIFAAEEEGGQPDQINLVPLTIGKKPATLLTATDEELTQTRVRSGYTIGIAIDCDRACVARLNQYAPGSGQGTDASSYLTALIAGTSAVYERDLGRALSITFLRLWDRQEESPTNSGNIFASGTNSLSAYRNAWSTSAGRGTEDYDVAHLMTGIQEGGVAYVGTVCRGSANVGVSSLRGQWQGATSGSSAYMWDLEVTAHELGHNFGSGHSHDYDPPIDECVSCRPGYSASQCTSGGSAVGPVDRDDARCVKGTVMSYCHLCGGMANINMNFHPRAIERIQGVLESQCGSAGPAPPPTPPGITRAPTPAPPPTPPPTYAPGTCRDQNSACTSYGTQYCASQTSGTVTINNEPYNDYCCATCASTVSGAGGSGPAPASTCSDQTSQCSSWGSRYCGRATVNGQPFAEYCCATCSN